MTSNFCLAPLFTGGKGYGQESGEEDFKAFRAWLQCYGVAGMSSLRDRHGRTIWFQVRALTVIQRNRPQAGGYGGEIWGHSWAAAEVSV